MTSSELHLHVLAGGDPLRRERLTGELRRHLDSDQALSATGLTVGPAPPPPAPPRSKGAVEVVVALLVAGAPYARPAADVLTAAIESWCGRDHRVAVRLEAGGRAVEITGSPTQQQQELVSEFFRQLDDPAPPS